jgi:hypothetical protein
MPKIILEADVRYAHSLVQQGCTLRNAAKIVHIGNELLSRKFGELGLSRPGKNHKAYNKRELPEQEILQLYASGMGTTALATRYKTVHATIMKVLERNGVPLRTCAQANQIVQDNRTAQQRVDHTQKARIQRLNNLRKDSYGTEKFNPAVGTGYHFLADALETIGTVQRQVAFMSYYIDVLLNGIAVEIEYSPRYGLNHKSIRLKKMLESNLFVVYISHDGIAGLKLHLQHILSWLQTASRHNPASGDYWVIRCDANRGVACLKYDKGSVIERSKHPNWVFMRD